MRHIGVEWAPNVTGVLIKGGFGHRHPNRENAMQTKMEPPLSQVRKAEQMLWLSARTHPTDTLPSEV